MALRDRQAARYCLDDLGAGSPALARIARAGSPRRHQRACRSRFWARPAAGKEWLARAIHARSELRHARSPASMPPASRRRCWAKLFLACAADSSAWARSTCASRTPCRANGRAGSPRHCSWAKTRIFRASSSASAAIPPPRCQAGRLLAEFYCAVSPVTITLPPMRDRLGELPRFVDIFLQRFRDLQPHRVQAVSPEALSVLRAYAWPGNLGELQEVLLDACRRAEGDRMELADLPFYLKQGAAAAGTPFTARRPSGTSANAA